MPSDWSCRVIKLSSLCHLRAARRGKDHVAISQFGFFRDRIQTRFISKGSLPSVSSSLKSDRTQDLCGSVLDSRREISRIYNFTSGEAVDCSRELELAVKIVHIACCLCQDVQKKLILSNGTHSQSKDDNSPVTVADWSVQAVVSWLLSDTLGSENVSIMAEEDIKTLSTPEASVLLKAVVNTVNHALLEAPRFGFERPSKTLGASEVLEAISRCRSSGGSSGRFWTLDPVDGTLGFVRGDQYAVGLALIEDGNVLLGVIGCPNYPMGKEWLSNHPNRSRIFTEISSSDSVKGCIFYAMRGSGKAWMQPLLGKSTIFSWPNLARHVQVSSIQNPKLATFCEPVEKSNSNHSFTDGLAQSVGVRNRPLRVYSMVKYAAIARGDAEIFMKFPQAGYKEKIWDHAPGIVIIAEAGGLITDAGGKPLNFSKGMFLEDLDRGIVACSSAKLHETLIKAVDASWDSSKL